MSERLQDNTSIESSGEIYRRPVVRITANLPVKVFHALKELSDKRDVTMTELIRQAISTERFFMQRQEAGETIVVVSEDKNTFREVIFLG